MSDRKQKQEQLKKLMEEHPEINDKLKELNAANQQEMQANAIGVMKEYGMELTAEDFKVPQGEVSDDELEAVAGGGCGCAFGGAGALDYLDCYCAIIGGGNVYYNDKKLPISYGGCSCGIAGAGATNWGDEHPDLKK